jgi:hypothetical protein
MSLQAPGGYPSIVAENCTEAQQIGQFARVDQFFKLAKEKP